MLLEAILFVVGFLAAVIPALLLARERQPQTREQAIEAAKESYAKGDIELHDLEARIGHLASLPPDWKPREDQAGH